MYHMQANVGPTHVLKPAFGTDLLNELQGFVRDKGINLAWISGLALGAADLLLVPAKSGMGRAYPRACSKEVL